MGGGKAVVKLDRRPLVSYPLEAVWRALGNVAVVAKVDTELPSLPGAAIWIEPSEPRHPLTGILHALSLAEGRRVLICAADMPLVTPSLIGALAFADAGGAPAVVASTQGQLQPLLARFAPSALQPLSQAARDPGVALREAVAALHPVLYEVEDRDCLFNVNSPDDLLQAAAMLDHRRRVSRRGRAPG
jgi:molybdenum cofactor guanylyltransferase